MPETIILPAQGCRRSKKVLEYLEEQGVRFKRIDLESPEGQALADEYELRASPGILVNGESVNPYDILIPAECRVDTVKADALFGNDG